MGFILGAILAIVMILHVWFSTKTDIQGSKLLWILAVFVFSVFGYLAYIMVNYNSFKEYMADIMSIVK